LVQVKCLLLKVLRGRVLVLHIVEFEKQVVVLGEQINILRSTIRSECLEHLLVLQEIELRYLTVDELLLFINHVNFLDELSLDLLLGCGLTVIGTGIEIVLSRLRKRSCRAF
jgi:hypothetical protein